MFQQVGLVNLFSIFQAVCVIFLTFVLFTEYKKRQYYKGITKKIPTVYGLPLVGYLYKWIPHKNFLSSFDKSFQELKCSTFFTFIATNPFIVTIDPDIIQRVLTSEDFLSKAHSFYDAVDRSIHNGIITSNGQQWKNNRKLLNSSFNHSVLVSFMPIYNKGAKRTVLKFQELVGKGEVAIFEILKRIVFNIAFETTMGVDLRDNEFTDEKLVQDFNYLIRKVSDDSLLSVLHLGFLVRSPKYYKIIESFREYIRRVISKNLNKYRKGNVQPENDTGIKKSSDNFINQALNYQSKGRFTQENVVSESLTMLAGSFDTVSTTMYSLLVLLSMHPEIQEKVYEEVYALLPKKDALIDLDHIKNANIPYTDMVLDETLRLMPSIPFGGREICRNTRLTNDIYLPKDVQIAIPIFSLHRSKDLWGPDANLFNPDNFLPENICKRHPYAFIPFSKGIRNCLGWRYAHIVLRVLTLSLVRNFKFSTNSKYEDLVLLQKISLRYENEPYLKIEERS